MAEAAPDAADIYPSAAIVRMLSNDTKAAMELLGRAVDAGLSPSIVKNDPQFAPLGAEPGLEKLGRR